MSIQYAGGTNVSTTFAGTTKALIQSNVITQLTTAGWTQATGPTGGGAQTITVTIATPGVVSLASHALLANDSVVFSTTGALPTGITAGTRYFVKTVLTSGTFTISTTSGGTAINTTGSQSGVQSMVGTCRMATATTAWGVTGRIKLQDNGGNCITFSAENSNSTLVGGNTTSAGGFLLPVASPNFRIIANKYQAFIFLPITTTPRGFVAFGTPYLPTFLQGVLTECMWMATNAQDDSSGGVAASFRTVLRMGGATGNSQGIANTTIEENNTASGVGVLMLITPLGPVDGYAAGQTGTHWHDSSAMMLEPLIAWGNSRTLEPLIRGQLWDAALICDTFVGDTTTTFDSHNWWGLTDNDSSEKGTLFIVG